MNVRAVMSGHRVPRRASVLLIALVLIGPPMTAQGANPAQPKATQGAPQPTPTAPTPSADTRDVYDTAMQELIELFIQRGLMTREEADALVARVRAKVAAEADQRAETSGAPEPEAPGSIRVVYLSDVEKGRIREEIRKEVVAKAGAEGWAQPGALPSWVRRVSIDGDLRVRYELDAFDSSNAPFINFQAINSGPPYDTNIGVTNFDPPPFLNTTEDRRLLRLRARLGLAAEIGPDVQARLRLATGSANNPASTNQTLGADSNKLTVLLDQAYLNYQPLDALDLDIGRVPNPYIGTELVWDEDVNLDGLAVRYSLGGASLTVGAFAFGYTPHDFPATRTTKIASRDKWLYGAQLGTTWQVGNGGNVTLASSYYYFDQIQGERSSPCQAATSPSGPCDTDPSRPGFLQKGNTLFALRDASGNPAQPQFQYFGLASPFRELNATARLDLVVDTVGHVVLEADAVANLAYDADAVRTRGPVNNFGKQDCDADGNNCVPAEPPYEGGDTGFLLQVLVGEPKPVSRGMWNFTTGYRRIESDAVLDGFNDSDFHLGGTNAKGYTIGGALGFAKGAWLALRWLSATEVSGPSLASDVYQLDLNARF